MFLPAVEHPDTQQLVHPRYEYEYDDFGHQKIIRDIVDYDLPMFGAFHSCAFINIRKEYPLQARRVMHAVWGAGQMAWTKMIVVVDEHVNVHDHEDVGHKIGFDVTKKIHGEQVGGHPIRDWPTRMEMSEEMRRRVERRWGELGLE